MSHPILQKMQNVLGPNLWPRFRMSVIGIAQDFWKDPEPTAGTKPRSARKMPHAGVAAKQVDNTPRWRANRVQVIEKIWGEGMSRPGDESLLDGLLSPLGLNREMNVIDLAAGLGGLARKIASDYNAYVAGMEIDPELAKRGMELSVLHGKAKHASIEHYDPTNFVPSKHFDCLVARDIFYRVADREKFFKTLSLGIKPRGQLSFTDFILEPEKAKEPAVVEWLARDKGANPLNLSGMTQAWKKLGFDVRVNEDQTKVYHTEILKGLAIFSLFLRKNPPDEATKLLVKNEIEKWGCRAKAMEQGLKYCRFYAIKT